MSSDEDILKLAAEDGSLDIAKWPELLEAVILRLDNIVHNDFPIPTVPLPKPPPPATLTAEHSIDNNTYSPNAPSSQRTEKLPTQGSTPPTQLDNEISPNENGHRSLNSQASLAPPEGTLPPQLLSFYTSLKSNLTTSFSSAPPYTIQRLAELILHPTSHYRTLPAYLRALDRTISVSSTSAVFPLPASALDAINPTSNGAPIVTGFLEPAVGKVDDFNGAALTRIPWLRDSASMMDTSERTMGAGVGAAPATDLRTESTSVIDGPNGAGSIETVTVAVSAVPSTGAGAPTAQTHLATVPTDGSSASGLSPSAATTSLVTEAPQPDDSGRAALPRSPRNNDEDEEERPHARGPEEIGMEDMGPQSFTTGTSAQGPAVSLVDAEKAMGRPGEGEVVGGAGESADEEQKKEEEVKKEQEGGDADAEADTDPMAVDEDDKSREGKA